ncbi:MAG: hypothetical protein O6942_07690 [Bacteroidetes bacterium]|nr:hypothetical protein [Bacteroidota bacterium]
MLPPEVDLKRVGALGHSTGALTTLYLAALKLKLKRLVLDATAVSESWLQSFSADAKALG